MRQKPLLIFILLLWVAAAWFTGCAGSMNSRPGAGDAANRARLEAARRLQQAITAAVKQVEAIEVYVLPGWEHTEPLIPRARYKRGTKEFRWLLDELLAARTEGTVAEALPDWRVVLRAGDRKLLALNYCSADGRIEKPGNSGVLFLTPRAKEMLALYDVGSRAQIVRRVRIGDREYPVLHCRHTEVLVKAPFPGAPTRVPPLLVAEQLVSTQSIVRSFFSEADLRHARISKREDGRTCYRVGDRLLEVYPTGGHIYRVGSEIPDAPVGFGREEAIARAEKFLEDRGIDVNRLAVEKVWTLQETRLDLSGEGGKKTGFLAYQVEFGRTLNGLPLANGDRIAVEVSDKGVTYYFNGQRKIKGTGEPRPVIPVEEALRELEANLHRAFSMGPLEEITEIRLVYYVAHPAKPQKVIPPAWAFKLGNGGRSYAYVDAHSGRMLLDY
ncbi:MAG: hypothetical protein AB1507_05360 [Bacillota bacterium]